MYKSWKEVPIPRAMQALRRDPRGYPIPFVVQWDRDEERAFFTINDSQKTAYALMYDLCHICGGKLHRGKWFVGGPQSAFHRHGVYIDGPMHRECAHYAMQVCPWLAAPKYARRLDDAQVDWDKMDPAIITPQDNTMIPDRPDVFVMAGTTGKVNIRHERGTRYLDPVRRWWQVEYWQQGVPLTKEQALGIWKEAGTPMGDWVFMETER